MPDEGTTGQGAAAQLQVVLYDEPRGPKNFLSVQSNMQEVTQQPSKTKDEPLRFKQRRQAPMGSKPVPAK